MSQLKHLLRTAVAFLLVLGVAAVAPPSASAASGGGIFAGSVSRAPNAEAELLYTINRTRADYGLPALRNEGWGQYEGYLNCLANQNASIRGLEHYPSECGLGVIKHEIIAARYFSDGASVNALASQWNLSDGHRKIMLATNADYAHVGVFCIGDTSWAVAWVGTDSGRLTTNPTAAKSTPQQGYTGSDYRCRDSQAVPLNNPRGAIPDSVGTIAQLVGQPGFDKADADVLRLYTAFFRREPEIDGAKYWINLSNSGTSIDEISYQFAASQEFRNTYGGVSNRRYLEILYGNVLGRQPDPSGFNYWLGQLESGQLDRGGVVRWVAANAEFVNTHQYGGK